MRILFNWHFTSEDLSDIGKHHDEVQKVRTMNEDDNGEDEALSIDRSVSQLGNNTLPMP